MFFAIIVLSGMVTFLWCYAFEEKKTWWYPKEESPNLTMPELSDISSDTSEYLRSKYYDEVILPAHYYFEKFSELRGCNSYQPGEKIGYWIVGVAPTIVYVYRIIGTTSGEGVLLYILRLLALPIIWLAAWLIYRISKLHIPDFQMSYSSIASYSLNDYRISTERDINNNAIKRHLEYLISIQKTIHNREAMRPMVFIIGWLCVILMTWATNGQYLL